MSLSSTLEELLSNLLYEARDLSAALILDLDGLVIAKQSVKGFDEELIGAIMTILEQTITKIRRYAETSFGSGTFDTNEFQLFYVELRKVTPAIFVLIADSYANIDQYIPYTYIVAEKISLILNNRSTSLGLPKLDENGELVLKPTKISNSNGKVKAIAIIGSEEVGKSTLVDMFCNIDLATSYKPTIGISIKEKSLQISKNYNVSLILFDLGGLKSFVKVRKFYYKFAHAILLLFDYTKPETLNHITKWIEEVQHFIGDQTIPIILIGNKIDISKDRVELKNQAQQLADQHNFSFFETSAFTGEGIDELFTFFISNLF